ncbi:putative membrane protein [Propionispora sp. 2/2-37]|nr:putative membrane protein [Propionispora sp. 2/2-37]
MIYYIITFLLGGFIGAVVGVLMVCMCVLSKENK